jgi:hypothetical protein
MGTGNRAFGATAIAIESPASAGLSLSLSKICHPERAFRICRAAFGATINFSREPKDLLSATQLPSTKMPSASWVFLLL